MHKNQILHYIIQHYYLVGDQIGSRYTSALYLGKIYTIVISCVVVLDVYIVYCCLMLTIILKRPFQRKPYSYKEAVHTRN